MVAPIVTLTTDFGLRDSYVAQLKGVLLALGPTDLRIVDLSHEIGPQRVREGAFLLREAVPRFPPGTIHVAVVDPGVGSARRPLALEVGGQLLLGPDNGLFGLLLHGTWRAHAIAVADPASSTFHGRDVFAPAAARLARGEALEALGPVVRDPLALDWPAPERHASGIRGEVVHVDRFGNLISNIERRHAAVLPGARVWLGPTLIGGIRDHYAEVARGAPLALFGSSELLEVAVRDGNAAQILEAGAGSAIELAAGPS